jgi:type IV pilus biogenesis protein PilP
MVSNQGVMGELQAERETLRVLKDTRTLQRDIATLEKQTAEIILGPVIVAPPPQTPPVTAPEPEKEPVRAVPPAPVPTMIISIQGVNNALVAHVRHDNGEITVVRKGQSFAGGVVERITRDGITLMKNGRRVFIAYGD